MAEPGKGNRRLIRFELPPNPTDEELEQAVANIKKLVKKSQKKKKKTPSQSQGDQTKTR